MYLLLSIPNGLCKGHFRHLRHPLSQEPHDVFILDRFVLGQMLAPFLFGIMSFTVILVAGNLLFRLADLVIQRGVPLWTVVQLFI